VLTITCTCDAMDFRKNYFQSGLDRRHILFESEMLLGTIFILTVFILTVSDLTLSMPTYRNWVRVRVSGKVGIDILHFRYGGPTPLLQTYSISNVIYARVVAVRIRTCTVSLLPVLLLVKNWVRNA